MNKNKIASTAGKVSAAVRGLRNNNPGNIEMTFDKKGNKTYWKGEIDGSDVRFKVFKSMPFGFRAMFVTLGSYFSKGFNTIEKIISRYAPSKDNNDTAAYIRNVAIRLNIPATHVLNFKDVTTIKNLIAAMSKIEQGVEPDKSLIEEGYKLFIA